ncbi:MAG: hypothetical protein ACLQLC_00645 [Candidatus Sulfotelmatobacter sp.]
MTPDDRERLATLCQRIAAEKDSDKFIQLVEELNEFLSQKELRSGIHSANEKAS